jgi:hypothetical protein
LDIDYCLDVIISLSILLDGFKISPVPLTVKHHFEI